MEHHPETMKIEELARRLGIGRSLAYALARNDALPVPVIRLGTRLVVSRAAVEALLAQSVTSAKDGHPSQSDGHGD